MTHRRELIGGPNFSGRSRALRELLREKSFRPASFFVGPYAEAALSGISSTIADEIQIYRTTDARSPRPTYSPIDFDALADRRPQTLSGGEQVLLALHCFSRSAFNAIAVDTALEQLDGPNRTSALAYLERGDNFQFSAVLIDNRIEPPLANWSCREQKPEHSPYVSDFSALADALVPHKASAITIRDLHFGYRPGRRHTRKADFAGQRRLAQIFQAVSQPPRSCNIVFLLCLVSAQV